MRLNVRGSVLPILFLCTMILHLTIIVPCLAAGQTRSVDISQSTGNTWVWRGTTKTGSGTPAQATTEGSFYVTNKLEGANAVYFTGLGGVGDKILYRDNATGQVKIVTLDSTLALTTGTLGVVNGVTTSGITSGTIPKAGASNTLIDSILSESSNVIYNSNMSVTGTTSAIDTDVVVPGRITSVTGGTSFQSAAFIGNTNVATGPGFTFYKTRSSGTDGNTILQDGDTLASWIARGADGVTFRSAGQILFGVDGTPGASDMPGRIDFQTTLDGALSPSQRMRLNNLGHLMINTTTDDGSNYLQINGGLTSTTSIASTSTTTPIVIGGSGTTQTLTYKTTTGVGAAGADHVFQVGSNGGTEALRILNAGTVKLPQVTASKILRTDSGNLISPVTIGTGLTFDGTTLSNTAATPTLSAVTTAGATTSDKITVATSGTGAASLVIPFGTYPTSPNSGDLFSNGVLAYRENNQNIRFGGYVFASTNSSSALTTSGDTDVTPSTIPSDQTRNFHDNLTNVAGKVIHFKAGGVVSTAAATPGTLTMQFKLSTTATVTTGAITLPTSLSSAPWTFEADLVSRGSGTVTINGNFTVHQTSGTPFTVGIASAAGSIPNGGSASAASIHANWSTAPAGDSLTVYDYRGWIDN